MENLLKCSPGSVLTSLPDIIVCNAINRRWFSFEKHSDIISENCIPCLRMESFLLSFVCFVVSFFREQKPDKHILILQCLASIFLIVYWKYRFFQLFFHSSFKSLWHLFTTRGWNLTQDELSQKVPVMHLNIVHRLDERVRQKSYGSPTLSGPELEFLLRFGLIGLKGLKILWNANMGVIV